ncbi:MAG TPA: TlpA disulfide reductase family protein [Pyrinomonadaceae bacterium]|nr:TlpA disulfide reductase family protein [Pyrinomonadaceae bacterium]
MRTFNKIAFFTIGLSLLSFTASGQTSLQSISGGTVDVQAQTGKVVILAVGASWLPLSAKQAEFTNSLARKYAGRNVAVYFVATDSLDPKSKNHATNSDLASFVSNRKLSVPLLRDPGGSAIVRKFRVDQLPSFIILDKTGAISGPAFGGIDPKFDITITISKRVDSLL